MLIRLHEIELGVRDVADSLSFYQHMLGLPLSLDQPALKVFRSGNAGLDFNIASHIAPGTMVISFLTNDLPQVMQKLKDAGIPFTQPEPAHLGMKSISFKDADGHSIRVNEPTDASPDWLTL